MNKDLITAELAKRELARRYYAEYLPYAYGDSWIRTRMSAYLAGRIQKFIEAETEHAYDILIIECPPQHGKSMTVSESLPSWYLGKHPDRNIILASYDSDFAERFCRKNKDKIKCVPEAGMYLKKGPMGQLIIGTNQIDMDELLEEQEGA